MSTQILLKNLQKNINELSLVDISTKNRDIINYGLTHLIQEKQMYISLTLYNKSNGAIEGEKITSLPLFCLPINTSGEVFYMPPDGIVEKIDKSFLSYDCLCEVL